MLTALLVLFVLMGGFAGYWSATMYKFFNGKMWKRCTIATALLFPSMIFAIFWALDIMVCMQIRSRGKPSAVFRFLCIFGKKAALLFLMACSRQHPDCVSRSM